MRWFRRFVVLIVVAAVGAGVGASVRYFFRRAEKSEPVSQPAAPSTVVSPAVDTRAAGSAAPSLRAPEEKLEVVGYAIRGDKIRVALTDGRVLAGYDDSLGEVMPTYVRVDGRKVYLRQWRSPAKPEALPGVTLPSPAPVPADAASASSADVQTGSWRLDADGVQRLVGDQRIGEGYSGSGLR